MRCRTQSGLTFVELLIGAFILLVGIAAMFGAFASQTSLNEHTRNHTWAMEDASRVMERLRQQNTGAGCLAPSVTPPAGFASWDAWLASPAAIGGGGKSVQPTPATNELIVVSSSGSDPLNVTVAVCWISRTRVIGECTWNGPVLTPNDADGNGTITSPTMLSTMLSCRR